MKRCLFILLLCGCAKQMPQPPLPPGATTPRKSAAIEPSAIPVPVWVTLQWSNAIASTQEQKWVWKTGVMASTNLRVWYELTNRVYGTGGWVRVTLTNRPWQFECYRPFNR